MTKISKEALERFKELHPERFAELQERAKQEWDKPTIRQSIRYTPSTTAPQPVQLPEWCKRGLTLEQALEEFRAEHGDRHFLITDSIGHRYFEGAFTPEEAIRKAQQRHPNFCRPITAMEER